MGRKARPIKNLERYRLKVQRRYELFSADLLRRIRAIGAPAQQQDAETYFFETFIRMILMGLLMSPGRLEQVMTVQGLTTKATKSHQKPYNDSLLLPLVEMDAHGRLSVGFWLPKQKDLQQSTIAVGFDGMGRTFYDAHLYFGGTSTKKKRKDQSLSVSTHVQATDRLATMKGLLDADVIDGIVEAMIAARGQDDSTASKAMLAIAMDKLTSFLGKGKKPLSESEKVDLGKVFQEEFLKT